MSQTISLYPTIIRYGMYKFCQALTPLDQIRNDDVLCDVVAIRAKKLPIFLIILVSHFLQFLFSKSKAQRMYEMVMIHTRYRIRGIRIFLRLLFLFCSSPTKSAGKFNLKFLKVGNSN